MNAPSVRFEGRAHTEAGHLFGPLQLQLGAGEWTCLLGPSGVGKTTILRLLAGLETGVAFEGEFTSDDGAALAGRVAYMAQTDLLMPWLDVTQNVLLGARLRGNEPDRSRADHLISQVGLTDHTSKRPGQLSGGMRQRVALARTLMEDKPIVLLDEPFSALDAKTRAEMQELASGLLRARTVLLVTHDPAEAARLGHKIFLMNRKDLVVVPPPNAPAIRAYDDPEVFACQTRLMALIREAA